MPDLGGARRLRGFREFRFRDRNSVLATAEYRWEAWWLLDMAVFVDGGNGRPPVGYRPVGLGWVLRIRSSLAQ